MCPTPRPDSVRPFTRTTRCRTSSASVTPVVLGPLLLWLGDQRLDGRRLSLHRDLDLARQDAAGIQGAGRPVGCEASAGVVKAGEELDLG